MQLLTIVVSLAYVVFVVLKTMNRIRYQVAEMSSKQPLKINARIQVSTDNMKCYYCYLLCYT